MENTEDLWHFCGIGGVEVLLVKRAVIVHIAQALPRKQLT
jgi:hypothetical protein